ncbi:MAG: PAS domain-containing sensor histidine kinase [Nocardioides sp.]|nr:PAS domain-containing sensor histidine kinase [Nocardioides sp.]
MASDTPAPPPDLVDLLPDGVVVADGSGTVTAVNPVAAALLGIDDPAEGVGRPLSEVLRLDQDSCGWTASNTPYDGLASRSGIPEQSWLTPSGEEVLTTARLHRAGRGGPVTAVAVTIRSGRGRARLDRERSDLVATLAHELRSPLTGVKGFVQALLNRWDKLSDEQKKLMLTTVSVDSDRLSRLIAELLDVARIDTGRLQLYPRPSDAAVLVRRVVDSVGTTTHRPLSLAVADDLPQVQVDPDKFTQVVTNLLENAVRHGDGDVEVTLEPARVVRGGPAGVRLSVRDHGEGIPVELRRRVVTKFWTSGVRGGSGLGLYIVNGLVHAHGGTLVIDDAPGGGALLACTWPGVPADLA